MYSFFYCFFSSFKILWSAPFSFDWTPEPASTLIKTFDKKLLLALSNWNASNLRFTSRRWHSTLNVIPSVQSATQALQQYDDYIARISISTRLWTKFAFEFNKRCWAYKKAQTIRCTSDSVVKFDIDSILHIRIHMLQYLPKRGLTKTSPISEWIILCMLYNSSISSS